MHGRQQSGEGGAVAPLDFHTDKVEGCLMVLFFGLVFFRCPPPGNFSSDALLPSHGKSRVEHTHTRKLNFEELPSWLINMFAIW